MYLYQRYTTYCIFFAAVGSQNKYETDISLKRKGEW